ncbi:DUF433 domain-containing protein [bacterium]|nr:DUF433 domain-containing protein [bacterium]
MTREEMFNRITVNPGVCGGKPCVRDTRIEIAVILDGLADGMVNEEIVGHYPQLTIDDIQAALAFSESSGY